MFQPRHAHATVQKKVKVAEVCVTKVAKPLTREFGSGEKNNMRTVQELKHTCNTFSAHISAQQAKRNCIFSNYHIFLSSCPEIPHPHKHIPTGSSTSQPLLQAPPSQAPESLFVSLHFFVFMQCVVLRQSPELRWKGGEEEKEDLQQPPAKSCKHTNRPLSERRSHTHINFVNGT